MIQLGIRISNPKTLKKSLNNLVNWIPALHIYTDDKFFIRKNSPVPVYKIPHFSTLNESVKFMTSEHTLPFCEALGSIGCSDCDIVINISHGAADGGYFKFLFDSLKKDYLSCKIPQFFGQRDQIFSKELDELKGCPISNSPITKIMPKDRTRLHLSKRAKSLNTSLSLKSLKCYNSKKGQASKMTDYFWGNMILAASAYNGKLAECGVATCLDSRPFSGYSDLTTANMFSTITVFAKNITPDTSFQDLMKSLRNNFSTQYKSKYNLAVLSSWRENIIKHIKDPPHPQYGASLELSKMGAFKLEGDFEDVNLSIDMRSEQTPSIISVMSYGVCGKGRNDVIIKSRYCPQNLSDMDASIFTKSLGFALQHISPTHQCQEAMNEIKQFQDKMAQKFHQDYSYI